MPLQPSSWGSSGSTNGSQLEEPFLDIQSIVMATLWLGHERGFLGMAVHPKDEDNGKFCIYDSYMAKKSGKDQDQQIEGFGIS